MNKSKKKKGEYPSLYDAFKLGDRVKRKYYDVSSGKTNEYKGIIMAIDTNSMEIFWDMVDGKYRPKNMVVDFTSCSLEEIFKGKNHYSSIKKDKVL
jgi:hypothetical protein